MSDKKSLAWRAPLDTYREVEARADENDIKKSDVLRRATEQYLEEDDEPARGRSVSPLALLGVVALAIAPTLLATGHTGLGVVAGGIAALYVLLWATTYDVVLEEALGGARDELREVGGVVGFFRLVMTDHHAEDPDSVVERAARLDIVASGLLVGLLAILVPFGVAAAAGVLEPLLAALGTPGVTAIVLAIVVLGYGGAVLMGVSALASLAVATALGDDPAVDEDAVDA